MHNYPHNAGIIISEIGQYLKQLRQEIERLQIRQNVINRYSKQLTSHIKDSEIEDDEFSDLLEHVEALGSDLGTFKEQLQDRFTHLEQGKVLLNVLVGNPHASLFHHYLQEEVRLTIRDAETARVGYDELIENITENIHSLY